MKNIGIALAVLTATVSAYGQGQVSFNNRVTTATPALFAPIYGVNPAAPAVRLSGNATTNGGSVNYTGVPLLVGAGFSASLWEGAAGAADGSAFEQIGANVTFNTATTLPGIFRSGGNVNTKNTTPATPSAFQVRAWDNRGGTITSWADALASSQAGVSGAGASDVFTMNIGGGALTPPALAGLRSFNLTIVPEPSLIALGALGFGALLLRRRK